MESLCERIIRKGKEFGEIEVEMSNLDQTTILFDNKDLRTITSGINTEIHIRMNIGKCYGYSFTSNITKWEDCLKTAVKLAKNSEPLPISRVITNKPLSSTTLKGFDINEEELIKKANEGINACESVDSRIKVLQANCERTIGKVVLMNSNGIKACQEIGRTNFSIECGIKNVNAFEISASRKPKVDFAKVGESAGMTCVASLRPVSIKPLITDVVLEYKALTELFNVITPSFYANNVQEKRSYFGGKTGEKVASQAVSIADNGRLPNGLMSFAFDGEGVSTGRTELINNGVLKGFLYDSYSAQVEGKESTGNCKDLSIIPSITETNLIIKKGNASNEELISKDCLLVTSLMGSHTCNPVSGDFAMKCMNSFRVERGKLIPVKECMISGNVFKLLENVELIGKDSRQDDYLMSPNIRIKNVQVIG